MGVRVELIETHVERLDRFVLDRLGERNTNRGERLGNPERGLFADVVRIADVLFSYHYSLMAFIVQIHHTVIYIDASGRI
ncbi:hypothetical protein PTKU46_79610 [Paraburkholderia terrae]